MCINVFQFNIEFNKFLFNLEECLDSFNSKHDIDYEINYHVMTILFSKNNKIIINKKETLKQIWLATKTYGYHFNYKNFNWICNRTQRNIWDILTECFYIQGKERIDFSHYNS